MVLKADALANESSFGETRKTGPGEESTLYHFGLACRYFTIYLMLLFDNSVEATTHRVVDPPELKTVNGDSCSLRPNPQLTRDVRAQKGPGYAARGWR